MGISHFSPGTWSCTIELAQTAFSTLYCLSRSLPSFWLLKTFAPYYESITASFSAPSAPSFTLSPLSCFCFDYQGHNFSCRVLALSSATPLRRVCELRSYFCFRLLTPQSSPSAALPRYSLYPLPLPAPNLFLDSWIVLIILVLNSLIVDCLIIILFVVNKLVMNMISLSLLIFT